MKKLTKQQFKDVLKDPRLFVARKKVRQLRKELAKINWKIYSKYISGQLKLELFDTGPSHDTSIGDAAYTVFKTFSFSEYEIEYVYDAGDQFRVFITV